MPAKRKATDTISNSEEGSSSKGQTKRASHTSRACDNCRRRKIRCDGQFPQCGVCRERDCPCEYKDEDKRKTHQEHMEELNNRMDRFEKLIEDLLRNTANPSGASNQHAPPPVQPSIAVNGDVRQIDPMVSITGDGGMNEAGPSNWATVQHIPDVSTSTFQEQSDPGVSPVASSKLRNLGGTGGYERFQRVEESAGALLQYGPTSLWTVTSPRETRNELSPDLIELGSGDWIDWSHNLPEALNLSRTIHDRIIEYFSAFYAPWGISVDVPSFLVDLNRCNLVRASTQSRPQQSRTASYSPLLHCCVIYLGLRLIKHEHPSLMKTYESVFIKHGMNLLLEECDHTALSSLRAYNLFSTCVHFVRMSSNENPLNAVHRQFATGYLYSGMAIAGVHALGLNINCAEYVSRGLISEKERNLREYAFWTIYISDTLRALAAGRQPMFPDHSEVPVPTIDTAMDETLWVTPSIAPGSGIGVRSMRSTTFHWMARLAKICRSILENLYSPASRSTRQDDSIDAVSHKLDDWYKRFPLRPIEITPLPHILLLHMYYHLSVIFVHRPFYRGHRMGSAQRCNTAAVHILELLHIFKRTHQIRYAHHNMINVIFGAATIFLLQIAEPSSTNDGEEHKRNFDQCVDFMAELSLTWVEAGITRNILIALQSEYELPRIPHGNGQTPQGGNGMGLVGMPSTDMSTTTVPWIDPFNDMQDIWGMMFNDQSFQWQDFGNGNGNGDGGQ